MRDGGRARGRVVDGGRGQNVRRMLVHLDPQLLRERGHLITPYKEADLQILFAKYGVRCALPSSPSRRSPAENGVEGSIMRQKARRLVFPATGHYEDKTKGE